MKQKLTENELRNVIYERVKAALSEAFGGVDDDVTAFILQPQYTNFIKTACHILSWKGLDFNLNIKGNEYRIAKHFIDSYISDKQEAMKSSNPKENVARVKEMWRNRKGCEGLVDAEKEAFERFTQFKEEGYEFISKYLGNKNNASKQMEKSAGLALFGKESDLNQFHIMHGAVFCVRDFFKWVEAGRPDVSFGQRKVLGDKFGAMVNKDELGNTEPTVPEDLSTKLKNVLDNSAISDNQLALELAGDKTDKDTVLKLMYLIGQYKKNKGDGARNVMAFNKLDELSAMVQELGSESVIDALASEQSESEQND